MAPYTVPPYTASYMAILGLNTEFSVSVYGTVFTFQSFVYGAIHSVYGAIFGAKYGVTPTPYMAPYMESKLRIRSLRLWLQIILGRNTELSVPVLRRRFDFLVLCIRSFLFRLWHHIWRHIRSKKRRQM